jgi:hypothetical protein
MFEQWKVINDYNNYEVSNFGQIRNKTTGRVLKPGLSNGYPACQLVNNGKYCTKKIHRLVAKAFIDNPNNLPQVDHINNNRTDNRVMNLRWATQSQNMFNKPKVKAGSSKYKGVYLNKCVNKWKARISINQHRYHLGHYQSEHEAGWIYNYFAKKHYQEFAYLNKIKIKKTKQLITKIIIIETKLKI